MDDPCEALKALEGLLASLPPPRDTTALEGLMRSVRASDLPDRAKAKLFAEVMLLLDETRLLRQQEAQVRRVAAALARSCKKVRLPPLTARPQRSSPRRPATPRPPSTPRRGAPSRRRWDLSPTIHKFRSPRR